MFESFSMASYIFTLFLMYPVGGIGSNEKCSLKLEVEVCHANRTQSSTSEECSKAKVCRKHFNITYVDVKPYGHEILTDLLRMCCGPCVNVTVTDTLDNMLQVPPPSIGTSNFFFPVFGRQHTRSMYGYRFIPLIESPRIEYITTKVEDLMPRLMKACIKLWPLIFIGLLMAVISGFFGWLFETCGNKEEFPRPFLIGLMDGMWWSFITMSGVGYGDKVPISVQGRLFSMFWIIVGITIFSLTTAMMNTEVMSASSSDFSQLVSSRIGSLRHRIYEANLVKEYEGNLIQTDNPDSSIGIQDLIKKLEKREIDGFVLDRYLLFLYKDGFKKDPVHREGIDFLRKKTVHRELPHRGEQYSYGILVKQREDFDFLADFVADNGLVLNVCNNLLINEISSTEVTVAPSKYLLFSASSDTFKTLLSILSIVLALIVCFGIAYEYRRHGCNFSELRIDELTIENRHSA